jgi:hypothetical protein
MWVSTSVPPSVIVKLPKPTGKRLDGTTTTRTPTNRPPDGSSTGPT